MFSSSQSGAGWSGNLAIVLKVSVLDWVERNWDDGSGGLGPELGGGQAW